MGMLSSWGKHIGRCRLILSISRKEINLFYWFAKSWLVGYTIFINIKIVLWECGVTFRMSFCSIFIIVHVWFLSIVNKDTNKFDFIVFWINGFLAGSNVFGLFFHFTFEIKLPSPVSLNKIKVVSYAICFIF